MITKDDFCRELIRQFSKSEGIPEEDITESHILLSSSLAVAMEHLGLIKDIKLQDYAQGRAGCFYPTEDCRKFITTREMLELLPDRI